MGWKKLFGKKTLPETGDQPGTTEGTADMKVVVVTDLGNTRTNNEDTGLYFRVSDPQVTSEKGELLMVADGMGGHAAGEIASKMAAEIISREYFKSNATDGIEKKLSKVFAAANKNIFEAASSNAALKGMGTTCTALVVVNNRVYYGHVGDSRAYIIKEHAIEQITTDHTYVQDLVKAGTISAAEAAVHPQRNILTNAMGTKPEVQADTGKCAFAFEAGDKLLICSDGLYDYLEDAEMAAIVNGSAAQEAAEALVEAAKKRGGHDNITVVLAAKTPVAPAPVSKETRDFIIPVTREIDLP